MSVRLDKKGLEARHEIAPQPAESAWEDRTFGLPTGLYVATIGLYFSFLAVMALGFRSNDMVIVIAICAAYVVMAFGTPMVWARMNPSKSSRAMSWGRLRSMGIDTWTGRNTAGSAAVQMLLLPALILFFGVAVVLLWAIL